jgi:hypothetical protein
MGFSHNDMNREKESHLSNSKTKTAPLPPTLKQELFFLLMEVLASYCRTYIQYTVPVDD